MVAQKILICGYSHCGTSILKSIIGHIEDVEEIYDECSIINKLTNKPFILCKYPRAQPNFFGKEYEDYIKIFIIRNPLFVFSSINKRKGHYNLSIRHSIEEYINVLKIFIKYKNNPKKNIYTIRYEDLFNNNFINLKQILNNIGLKYNDSIFDNTKYKNVICSSVVLNTKEKPEETDHIAYRTWQINQPFVLNNDISKIDLSENQKNQIINNPFILQIYPDIQKYFNV
jgi:hypothetical protein